MSLLYTHQAMSTHGSQSLQEAGVYETYYKGKRDLLWRQKRHTTMRQKHVRQPRLHEAGARETADWRAACVSQPSCPEHCDVGVHLAPAPRALAAALTRVQRGLLRWDREGHGAPASRARCNGTQSRVRGGELSTSRYRA